MKNKEPQILHSDPVKEIISNPPANLIRWGTTAITGVILLILLFSWFLRYPNIVPSPVQITTENPPVTLVSKITGRIMNLDVNDRENVKSGQLLAVMETAASIEEIKKLKQAVAGIKNPESLTITALPSFSELGEIQEYWGTFLKCISDYSNYITNDYYGYKIRSVTQEISGLEEYILRVREKERLYEENQSIEGKKFSRDSSLFAGAVFSESELEVSRQAFNKINIELQNVRLDHSAKIIELAQKNQELQDYKIKRIEEKARLYSLLNESLNNLKAQIRMWENTYLLISPVDGIVTFTRFWKQNQMVSKDEPVLSVVPFEPGDYIGRIDLKMQRSGKVKKGQLVNIQLTGYPYLEYGMVRGIVTSKSLVPTGDSYIIEITLPDGLRTLYGVNLEFTQNMQGTAEIMTDSLRLLQKIINPFRYLATKNRI
jgi:HlyD family secretion protein